MRVQSDFTVLLRTVVHTVSFETITSDSNSTKQYCYMLKQYKGQIRQIDKYLEREFVRQ